MRVFLILGAVVLCAASANRQPMYTLSPSERCGRQNLILETVSVGESSGHGLASGRGGLVGASASAESSGFSCRRPETDDERCEAEIARASAEAKINEEGEIEVERAAHAAKRRCRRREMEQRDDDPGSGGDGWDAGDQK